MRSDGEGGLHHIEPCRLWIKAGSYCWWNTLETSSREVTFWRASVYCMENEHFGDPWGVTHCWWSGLMWKLQRRWEVLEYNTYVKGKAYRICCEVECMVGKSSRMMTRLVHLWKWECKNLSKQKKESARLQKWFQDKKHVPRTLELSVLHQVLHKYFLKYLCWLFRFTGSADINNGG